MTEEPSNDNKKEWYKMPIVWIIVAIAIGYFLINLPAWQQEAVQRQSERQIKQSFYNLMNAALGQTTSSTSADNP